jgi:diacylglycerol kinase (ATP)
MIAPPLLILNPRAGSKRKSNRLPRLVQQLRLAFPNLETVSTRLRNDGIRLTQEAVKKNCRLIICAGGDGTINEVINGLAGSNAALAIIPTGTGNALAREIGLPMNAFKAGGMVPTLKPAAASLGQVNGRYFVLLAGIGFDAFIIQQVSLRLKRRFGIFAYLAAGFLSLFKYPYPTIRFKIEDRIVIGTCGFFFNARCPIGPFVLSPKAGLQEPYLDLYIFKGRGPVTYLRYILAVLLGCQSKLPDVEYQKVKEATISSDVPIQVHTDGELIEQSGSYRIGIAPERLNLLVASGDNRFIPAVQ